MHEEYQYLNLIKDILENGKRKSDRTGVGTISKFGSMMRFSLKDNTLPLLTTKKVMIRSVVEELLFFIRGQTNNEILVKKGCNIWTANSTREFLDKQGINRAAGDLGPIYGFQWRHYGAPYNSCHDDYTGQGIDQLGQVIEQLRTNPDSRRHVVVAWNPMDLPAMALPPCHCLFQFNVSNGVLSCILYQRSGDVGLGVPFNIASYSILTIMIAYILGYEPGEFIHFIGDTHIYLNHVEALKSQVMREPKKFPKLFIRPKREIKSIEDFELEDLEIENYDHHPAIKMDMAV
ncbi:Thymidylate synthase 3 [Astathelohania contejeani]|uniref:thymidylate synthase n=1 Tax=Astathelohania contejeani TaxID=164912 RepID=A0ABQ7HW64_9MICR|nr:Thymidylate synthase 3 [Thelohania contejeani]